MKLTRRCHAALGLACIPPWTVNAGLVAGDRRTLIVDTGYGSAADVAKTRDAGFDEHLTKPVGADKLARVLTKLAG